MDINCIAPWRKLSFKLENTPHMKCVRKFQEVAKLRHFYYWWHSHSASLFLSVSLSYLWLGWPGKYLCNSPQTHCNFVKTGPNLNHIFGTSCTLQPFVFTVRLLPELTGADLGGVQGVHPPGDDLWLSNTTGIPPKNMGFIGVEVEQETFLSDAPPPKKKTWIRPWLNSI